jgi:hypothetical protein
MLISLDKDVFNIYSGGFARFLEGFAAPDAIARPASCLGVLANTVVLESSLSYTESLLGVLVVHHHGTMGIWPSLIAIIRYQVLAAVENVHGSTI